MVGIVRSRCRSLHVSWSIQRKLWVRGSLIELSDKPKKKRKREKKREEKASEIHVGVGCDTWTQWFSIDDISIVVRRGSSSSSLRIPRKILTKDTGREWYSCHVNRERVSKATRLRNIEISILISMTMHSQDYSHRLPTFLQRFAFIIADIRFLIREDSFPKKFCRFTWKWKGSLKSQSSINALYGNSK